MRIVLLTSDGREHRYLANAIARAFPTELRAIVIADPPRRSSLSRARFYVRRYNLSQLASRLYAKSYAILKRRGHRRARTYERLLFPDGDPGGFERQELVRVVPGHNHESCLQILSDLDPHVILVYGTAIIREGVIRLARTRILNLHTGISPRYRGSHTIFWALHNEEPEWVGVTVHVLDEGIDSGPILRTGKPPINSDDDEDSLFCKSLMVGVELLVKSIRSLEEDVAVTPQRLDEGREYRFVDRTVKAERKVERLLRDGLLSGFPASQ